MAYAQHYLVTYAIWNKGSNISIYDYIDLAPKLFGKSLTLVDSLLYNPLEALRHIFTCTGFYILSVIKNIEDLLLPSAWFHFLGKIKHLLFIAIIIAAFLFYKRNKATINIKKDYVFNISLFVFFIAGIVPNFLIGYCPHYIQLHFILYVLFFSVLFFKNLNLNIKIWIPFLLIPLFFIATPSLKKYFFQAADFAESKNLPIQKLAKVVNKINDNKKHCLIAFQTNLHSVFEGNNFTGFDAFSINETFFKFIDKNKIDFIYVNQQLLDEVKLNKDKEWKLFIANPEKYGFYKEILKGTKNYLLVKKNIK